MADRNKYPKMETRKRFAEEWVNAHPNYEWVSGSCMIQRLNDTLTLSSGVTVPCWNPPKHYSEFIKLFVDIKYIVRNANGVKGSPWKWACEYRVMNEIRQFPYRKDDYVREYVHPLKEKAVARRIRRG